MQLPETTINTWTTRPELRQLYTLAASVPQGATAVEIGSYLGASTIYLAAALRPRKGRLICIDTWENQTMPEGERDTFDEFKQNVSQFGSSIAVIRKRTEKVTTKDIDSSIHFAFIDGDHSYGAVRHDFELVSRFLTEDGAIAFHDSTYEVFPDISALIGEALVTRKWLVAGNVGSLTWLRRAQRIRK